MINTFIEMLGHGFIQRALIVGLITGIISAIMGVSLVLKNFSMIGDGLSHVGFGAFALAVVLGFTPLYFALPIVIIAAFLMLGLSKKSSINADAMIALLSSSSLALGVVATSLSKGMTIDIYQFMFGSILTIGKTDLYATLIISAIVFIIYILNYNKIFAITFDENFSKAIGVNVDAYRMMLAIITALVIVIGMRVMGAMLISSLLLFPALSSLRLFRSFKTCLIAACIISAISIVLGISISFMASLPTGSVIVLVNLAIFIMASIIGKLKK